jgi:hypothetical protein
MLAGSQAQHCCCVNTNSCCCNCPHFQRNMWLNNTGCKSRVCARITTHSIFPLVPACPHPPLASSTSSAAGWRRPRWPAGRSPRSTPGPAPPGAWAGAAQRATRGGGTACHCLGSEVWVGGWVGGGESGRSEEDVRWDWVVVETHAACHCQVCSVHKVHGQGQFNARHPRCRCHGGRSCCRNQYTCAVSDHLLAPISPYPFLWPMHVFHHYNLHHNQLPLLPSHPPTLSPPALSPLTWNQGCFTSG